MDATEDSDIKLQRASADLIGELKLSLPIFLRHPHAQHGKGHGVIRKLVWWATLRDLVRWLEPFQEWPQLLDPHLATLLPPLIDALVEYVSQYHRKRPPCLFKGRVLPLSGAICRLLYTFCKIRGAKVISAFFSNEPRWIEPMLSALQNWDEPTKEPLEPGDESQQPSGLMWEERYVMLTWLSHLMLTPFDLTSISFGKTREGDRPAASFQGPLSLPPLAQNTILLATSHLARAGKEQDAAAALLVRLALRPDMQKEGMLEFLVRWVLASLQASENTSPFLHESIAHLSILAKIVSSADAEVVEPHLVSIFECVQAITLAQSASSAALYSSAVARKCIIKIARAICTVILQVHQIRMVGLRAGAAEDVLDGALTAVLGACSDKDTPVRLAASKAVGVIGIKLEPALAAQLAQMVFQGLRVGVFWEGSLLHPSIETGSPILASPNSLMSRNLSDVNAPLWHGFTMSLSNLLFRRCPPPALLPEILSLLLLALGFEQRSPTGVSMGSNVRDAACYGLWSLARRYTTAELLSIDVSTVRVIAGYSEPLSILQLLANELVITSTMDPAGNIRRGASAALQEMVGRHPDCILDGIALTQVVDYHAVALRSQALTQVVPAAAKLHAAYWYALFDGLLDWRGLGSSDAGTRRLAAKAFGKFSIAQGLDVLFMGLTRLRHRIQRIEPRNAEQKHGLVLALAASLNQFDEFAESAKSAGLEVRLPATGAVNCLWNVAVPGEYLIGARLLNEASHPHLAAEASCLLIAALARNVRKNSRAASNYGELPSRALENSMMMILLSLKRSESVAIESAVEALPELISLVPSAKRYTLAVNLLSHVDYTRDKSKENRRGTKIADGLMAGLGAIFDHVVYDDVAQDSILAAFVDHLEPGNSIETRLATLKSLKRGLLQADVAEAALVDAIKSCLEDYTTDQRGDIGSLIRIEAIDVVLVGWQCGSLDLDNADGLFASIVGLAAEKLDRVRSRAWQCLCGIDKAGDGLHPSGPEVHYAVDMDVSSKAYFQQLLSLSRSVWVQAPLLEGFVTSAGTGSETTVQAARSALDAHFHGLDDDGLGHFFSAFQKVLETLLTKERLALPALEVLVFILDTRTLGRLPDSRLNPKRTLVLVKNSHFKSASIPKLKAAVGAYVGLCSLPSIRLQVLAKLRTMLLHAYPQIRNAAADALFSVTQQEQLLHVNWAHNPKELRNFVAEMGALV